MTQVSTGRHLATVPGQLVHSCGFCPVVSGLYCADSLVVVSESVGHVTSVSTSDIVSAEQPTGYYGVSL